PSAKAPEEMSYLVQVTGVGFNDLDFRGSLLGLPANTFNGTYFIYDIGSSAYVLANTGQTNYLFCRGYLQHDSPADGSPYTGMFQYVNKHSAATAFSTQGTPSGTGLALEAVGDGTSNTVMFMETNGGWTNFAGPAGWVGMNWGHAPFYADFGMCPDHTNPNCDFTNAGGYGWGCPSSAHANGMVMTAFGDGSVRAISPTINYGTFV